MYNNISRTVCNAIASLLLASAVLPLLSHPLVLKAVLAQEIQTPSADGVVSQVNTCLQQVKRQQYSTALQICQLARQSARTAKYRSGEAKALLSLGLTYWSLSKYENAVSALEQALLLYQAINDRNGEAKVFTNLGLVYRDLSEYEHAIVYYEQALSIFRVIEDQGGEAHVLGNLASAYWSLADYQEVIAIYQQVRSIFREQNDRKNEAKALWGLGITHWSLSQHQRAISFYEQALRLFREEQDRHGEATMLLGLGTVYGDLSQHQQALSFYEQALPLFHELKNRRQAARVLNNMGTAYRAMGKHKRALDLFQQALSISQDLKGRDDEARTLVNLGILYRARSQPKRAIALFEKALSIFRRIQDKTGEGSVLSYLGQVHAHQGRSELAIVFLKKSVNVRETIRQGLRPLASELQVSYADSVSDTYRQLADLLLEQGRILEAQQVLELLKVQEIRDFNSETRAGSTVSGIALSPAEKAILEQFNSLIVFGQTLQECRQSNCDQLDQLSAQRRTLVSQYHQNIDQFRQELRHRSGDDKGFFDPELLGDAQALVEQTQAKTSAKTVLIYPLVLKKKLWLLWVASGGVVKSQPVNVSQAELSQTVLAFRQQMKVCASQTCTQEDTQKLQSVSQELYDWLIRPLESELTKNKVQSLIFALDRTVRYVPMAALHDGQQYLVEQYTLSTILSAALTDASDRKPFASDTQVLALGLSDAIAGFNPLQYVPAELNKIVRQPGQETSGIYPGQMLLNQTFNATALTSQLERRQHRIVHIATHGQFVPGNYLASFLLLGDGKKLSIEKIRTLPLMSTVDLVVLSACESALGGADQLDGIEIASMSYYFLTRKAKSVLASLWQVNDASTSSLMQLFYQNLAEDRVHSPITKAQALRSAQLNFIHPKERAQESEARATIDVVSASGTSLERHPKDLSHPYYWAPFILIGSGL